MKRPIRLGLLEGTVDTEGYKTSIRNELSLACRELGAELLCIAGGPWKRSPYHRDELRRNILYHLIQKENLDGIILLFTVTTFASAEETAELLKLIEGIPKISLGYVSEEVPYLYVPGRQAIRDMLDHLVLHHGYQEIAFITGPQGNKEAKERLNAFLEYQEERNIPEKRIMVEQGDFLYASGEAAMERMLEKNLHPEAIVASNDLMAFGAISKLREKGFSVPEDIAVVGFDDTDKAEYESPPLTTIRQPYKGICRTLVESVLEQIKDSGKSPTNPRMSMDLIIRSTCGCIPSIIHSPDEIKEDSQRDLSSPPEKIKNRKKFENLLQILQQKKMKEADLDRDILAPLMSILFSQKWDQEDYGHWNEYFQQLERTLQLQGEDRGNIFDKIRLLLTERKRTYDLSRLSEMETMLQKLHEFTRTIYLCTSVSQIKQNLLEWLPHFNIRFAQLYLFPALYIESKTHWPVSIPESIQLISQIEESKEAIDEVQNLGMEQILSREQLKSSSISSWMIGPLFSEKYNLGFLILEESINVSVFYESFCSALSSALLQIHNRNERDKAVEALRDTLKELEDSNLQLTEMSHKDALTGLFNRRGFISYADQTLSLARREDKSCLIIYCDMDKMKQINDKFGHGQGDLAIQILARCLTDEFRGSDGICRMGGDEFLILAYGSGAEDYPMIKKRLHQRLEEESRSLPYNVEASFGSSIFNPQKESTLRGLMEEADRNLYNDKKKKRRRSVYGRE